MRQTNWGLRHGCMLAVSAVLVLLCVSWTLGQDVASAPAVPGVEKVAAPSAAAPVPADDAAADQQGELKISAGGTFTAYYRDTDLRVVLRQLSLLGLKNIVATKEVTGKVTAALYDVTFEEALDSVLKSSGFVYRIQGDFVYVYTPDQLKKIIKAERQMAVRTFRLSYLTAADAQKMIAPVLSGEGAVALTPAADTGIGSSDEVAGGDSYATKDILVIKDYEENLAKVEEVLKHIDVRPQQVLIEATILSADLTESNALGVNFNILGGSTFSDLGYTSNTGMNSIQLPENGVGVPPAGRDSTTAINTGFNLVNGGFRLGIVTDKLGVFLAALETVTDVTLLANPKLMVINKQKGEVLIGRREGYLTTVVNQGISTQSVEFLETGTKLIVRPYIAKDGFIRMEVRPEDSDGGVDEASGLPQESTTKVVSNVLIRDGRTLVIGGLFRERTSNANSQVPLVGNIPVVGNLFRSTNDDTKRQEVIILLTPHIIKHEVAEAVGEQMKDDIERYRVGQRKGLKWWAVSRLARSSVNNARKELDRGRIEEACWYVDAALSLNPRLMEAIELKERLTGKAYWHDEARYSSIKYVIPRMLMQDMGKDFRGTVYMEKPNTAKKLLPEVSKRMGMKDHPTASAQVKPVKRKAAPVKVPVKKVNKKAVETPKPAEMPKKVETPKAVEKPKTVETVKKVNTAAPTTQPAGK